MTTASNRQQKDKLRPLQIPTNRLAKNNRNKFAASGNTIVTNVAAMPKTSGYVTNTVKEKILIKILLKTVYILIE